jgi:hypothetical protein
MDYAPITTRLQHQGITLIQYEPKLVAQQMTLDAYERVVDKVKVKTMTLEVEWVCGRCFFLFFFFFSFFNCGWIVSELVCN